MNDQDLSRCYTNGFSGGINYGIPSDSQGNNIVTGEGSKQKTDEKFFTCIDLEVYSVI